MVTIDDLGAHVGETVTLRGWLASRRSSGKVHFLQVRDGTGTVQCVMGKNDVAADALRTRRSSPAGDLARGDGRGARRHAGAARRRARRRRPARAARADRRVSDRSQGSRHRVSPRAPPPLAALEPPARGAAHPRRGGAGGARVPRRPRLPRLRRAHPHPGRVRGHDHPLPGRVLRRHRLPDAERAALRRGGRAGVRQGVRLRARPSARRSRRRAAT